MTSSNFSVLDAQEDPRLSLGYDWNPDTESFDHKPKLTELNGTPMPESFTKGQPIAQLQGKTLKCMAPQHAFAKYG